ncbi:MAG TPA: TonB-dependent receptor, partial [Chitinophagaceae bacterium]|nr:TonB-dependent receptor [Chitinophagaceae bacterium]
LWQALAFYEHKFKTGTTLVTGGQFQDREITSNDRGNHTVKQVAGFVMINQVIANNLFISPAGRVDWDERAGTELVPQINLSWRKGIIQLRGSAGKTIRQADFTERYNNYNKAFVPSGSIGNPNLEAERSWSYEAGADVFIEGFKGSVTAFRRDQQNVIDWVTTPYANMPRKDNLSPMGTYALASNIAKVNTSGLETDLIYSKHFNKHHVVTGSAGLVWLDSETNGSTPSFYISSHAKFLTNFALRYENKFLAVCINGVYKHRKPQEATAIEAEVDADCFMMNGRIDYFLLKNRISLFGEMDNIADARCGDLLGPQVPGRWLMGGVKIEIGGRK